MATDIQVTSLTASAGLGQVALTAMVQAPLGMTCLAYMQPAGVQFWASATNNRNAASLIATSDVGIAVHGGLADSTTRYYWARAVDQDGNTGDFYPASVNGGLGATTKTTTPSPNSITAEMLQDGIISAQKFIPGVTPVEILAALPNDGNYVGRMVFLTSNGKLYRHTGLPANAAGFTVAVDGGDITANTLHGNSIVAGTVSAAKMAVTQLSAIAANLGAVTAGTVTGATFTGNIFRTAATGRRVEISAGDNFIKVYNSAGQYVASLGEGGMEGAYLSVMGSSALPIALLSNSSANGIALMSLGRNDFRSSGANNPTIEGTHSSNLSNAHAIRGRNTGAGGGEGYVGLSGLAGGWALFQATGTLGPFTGAHPGMLLKEDAAVPGDILVDVKVLGRKGIDDTLTEVARSSGLGQRNIIGVLSSRRPYQTGVPLNVLAGPVFQAHLESKYDLVTVNAVGEGQLNVCGLGGDIDAGDLICTSDMPGKGQRQNGDDAEVDDLVRRCTVARARESVSFINSTDVKQIACVYLSG